MLGVLLHVPRGPFYSPKAARSRWIPTWKANLAFCRVVHRTVRCTTGHLMFMSGAWFLSTRRAADRWSPGSVGASDTVRCTPDSLVCPTDHWCDHVSREDCAADRWLTGQSGAPSDSPVNFSCTSLILFPRAMSSRGWLTGQSGAPPDSPVNYSRTPPSIPESNTFTGDQTGAPDTVRCTTG
jgi:hypothetical protein